MMIVPLNEIPRDERHLLFCTRLTPRRRPRATHKSAAVSQLAAINRSLAVHGDSVAFTWPTQVRHALPV